MTPPAPGLWIPYARVSTDEQARDSLSVPNQIAEMEDWASDWRRMGVDVRLGEVVCAVGGESAFKLHRPSLDELRRRVRRERAAGIVVLMANRFARRWALAGAAITELTTAGIGLRSVTQPDIDETRDGQLRAGHYFVQAEQDSADKSNFAKRRGRRDAERGRANCVAPYGYLNAPKGSGTSFLPDPDRAWLIIEVFERVAAGERPADVLAHLRRTGRLLPHRDGRDVDVKAVFEWLRNEKYFGRLKWGRVVGSKDYQVDRPGDWTPLVSEGLFDAAQAAMKRREVRRRRSVGGFRFKGLIVCAGCGYPLTATEKHKQGRQYAYYHCHSKTKGPGCHSVRRDDLDAAMLTALDALSVDHAALDRRVHGLKASHAQAVAEQATARKQWERNKQQIEAKRVALVGHLENGTLKPDMYAKVDAGHREALGKIELDLRRLAGQTVPDVATWLDFVRDVLSNPKAAYLAMTPKQGADLLDVWFEKVTLEGGKVRTHLRGFLFNHLAGVLDTQCRVASPTGFEPGF